MNNQIYARKILRAQHAQHRVIASWVVLVSFTATLAAGFGGLMV